MVYTVMSGHDGLKLADNNSGLRKYGAKKTYRKWRQQSIKPVCTLLENDNKTVCKFFRKPSHPPTCQNQATANEKEVAYDSQQALGALIMESLADLDTIACSLMSSLPNLSHNTRNWRQGRKIKLPLFPRKRHITWFLMNLSFLKMIKILCYLIVYNMMSQNFRIWYGNWLWWYGEI